MKRKSKAREVGKRVEEIGMDSVIVWDGRTVRKSKASVFSFGTSEVLSH